MLIGMQFTVLDTLEILCSIGVIHYLTTVAYTTYGTRIYIFMCAFFSCLLMAVLFEYTYFTGLLMLLCIGTVTLTFFPSSHHAARFSPAAATDTHWIEHIVPLSIQAFHSGISLIWIIEHETSLQAMLSTDIPLQTPLSPKLSSLLLPLFHEHKIGTAWVNRSGIVVGFNPSTKNSPTSPPTLSQLVSLAPAHNFVLIHADAPSRTYTLWHKYTVREQMSSHYLYNALKQMYTAPHYSPHLIYQEPL